MPVGAAHAGAKLALFLALVANVTGQAYLFVVLPALGRRMDFPDVATGAVLSISALLLIAAAPAWGYVSERIGRRPVILAALAGAGLGLIAFGLVTAARLGGALGAMPALGLVFAARAFQVLFVGGLLPSVQAYMADITTPQQRVGGMGLIGAAYGLGAIGGAGLAWRTGGSDPALPFFLAAAFVAVAIALVCVLAHEPERHAAAMGDTRDRPLARIWPFVVITLTAFSAYAIVQQVMTLRLQDSFGFSVEESITRAGMGLLVTALAMVIVQGAVVRLLGWQPERLLLAGAAVGAAAVLVCGLVRSYGETLAVLAVFGAALGLMLPGNLACLSLRAGPGAQGKAAGINMMGQGLGLAAGPLAGAALHQVSPLAPFAAAAVLLVAATALAAGAGRRRAAPDTA